MIFIYTTLITLLTLITIIPFLIKKNNPINKSVEKYESITTDNLNNKMNAISSWDLQDPIKYTGDCYRYSGNKCLKFRNCGISDGKCVPGDFNGPYYLSTGRKWIYRDVDNKKIKFTKPYNQMIKGPWSYFQYNNFTGIN